MLDAIQSISGAMEMSFEAMCDVMMEILRQWMELVGRERARGEIEEKAATCCGCRRIGGCFLLARRSNSFFTITKHTKEQDKRQQ
jgi:hypothetical protein